MMTAGTILIEKHAAFPPCFHLKDSSPADWMAVTHNLSPHELEKKLSAAGWTFFCMANAIKTKAIGFHRAKMIDAALKRLVTTPRHQRCNCLEFDGMATRSFLGLPYAIVSAHPRQIQKGMVFSGH